MSVVPSTEERVQQTARSIFAATGGEKPGRFSRERLQGDMMEWAMADERLKVEMLRFVDVFPTLRDRSEIARHLREYFAREGVSAPKALRWGISLTGQRSPMAPLASAVIRRQMKGFAQRFIVGRDARDAVPALRALRDAGTGFTLDVLGEATVSEAEAHVYQGIYLDLLDGLAAEAASWPAVPIVDDAPWGPLPRVNLSLKITSLYSQIDAIDFDGSVAAVKDRLRPIFHTAIQRGASLTLDLEQFRYRDLTLEVFTSLLDEEEFRGYDDAGVVLQAYLRDADRDLERLLAWAHDRGRSFHLRLVKGAYWDYETVIAAQEGWPVPVFTHKPDTDAMYEKLTRVILADPGHVRPAFASHNVRSLAVAIETARDLGLAQNAFEIQMLHGMGDPIKAAIRGMGLRLREYAPVGELIPGMAYLVRRLLENTANDSFLRQRFVEGAAVDELIRPPEASADFGAQPRRLPVVAPTDPDAPAPFRNQPHADFSRRENREAYVAALAAVRGRFGAHYPLRIGGRDTETASTLESVNPAEPDEVVGTVAYGGRAEAEAAVAAAHAALPAWRDAAPAERAAVLFRAAELMRAETMELSALMTLESGKTRREADGDVDEAIDFLEYYGREMLRLGKPRRMGHAPGEHNVYFYQPRGVALVIAPWNFPLAILTGMTAAALVAGNPVIVKPAGPTPVIAAQMVRLLEAAGAPPGTVNYLPSPGGEVGDFLVRHPGVDLIAFTGSMEVGLSIISQAAQNPAAERRQEGHRRDGRQERDHRRHRRRPRRGRRRSGHLRVPLPGPEVLGRLAGHRARGGPRRVRAAPRGGDEEPHGGPAGGPGHARRAGHHRRRAGEDRGVHRSGAARGDAGRRRRAARWRLARRRLLRRPARLRRRPPRRGDRAGGDLRPGRRRPEGGRPRRGADDRERRPLRAHRRSHQPQPGDHRARAPRVPRRQPLHQPRHHRRPRRTPAVRRLQDERRRLQGRRPRLPAPVPRAARDHREHDAPRLRASRRTPGRLVTAGGLTSGAPQGHRSLVNAH